jgi:hypothetical protein
VGTSGAPTPAAPPPPSPPPPRTGTTAATILAAVARQAPPSLLSHIIPDDVAVGGGPQGPGTALERGGEGGGGGGAGGTSGGCRAASTMGGAALDSAAEPLAALLPPPAPPTAMDSHKPRAPASSGPSRRGGRARTRAPALTVGGGGGGGGGGAGSGDGVGGENPMAQSQAPGEHTSPTAPSIPRGAFVAVVSVVEGGLRGGADPPAPGRRASVRPGAEQGPKPTTARRPRATSAPKLAPRDPAGMGDDVRAQHGNDEGGGGTGTVGGEDAAGPAAAPIPAALAKRAGKRLLTCATCDFSTAKAAALARHEQQHAEEKPFKCRWGSRPCALWGPQLCM